MEGNSQSGVTSAGGAGVAPQPRAVVPTVDPDGAQPGLLRRDVIMEQALSDVE